MKVYVVTERGCDYGEEMGVTLLNSKAFSTKEAATNAAKAAVDAFAKQFPSPNLDIKSGDDWLFVASDGLTKTFDIEELELVEE